MNAFCPNLSNKKIKQEFDELTSLFGEDAAYFLWDKNNGYSLDKAPNGADSILFKSLLDNYNGDRQAALKAKAKVYTSSFTNWFGDWTKKDKTKVTPNTEASKKLISYIAEISNRNNKFSKLAQLLLDNKALPYNLKYFKIDNNRDDIEGAAGMWHSLVNYIEVLGNNVSQESIDKHLLHELIHYNTERILQDYKDNKTIDDTKKEAIKNLYNIITYAKDFLSKELQSNRSKYVEIAKRQSNTVDSRLFYAFDNQGSAEIDEFISEIFTNPGFQEVLNNIPYKESEQTLWDKIKDAICSIFGFDINKGSILEEALKASSTLLQNNNDVSKVVDENGEPLVVYHGSDSYGFNIFDPSKSDDKISLFASSSKWIASTYTSFKPLENTLVRKALLKGNAIDLIKNKDWKSLEKLINSVVDNTLSRPEEGGYPLPYGNKKVLDKILTIQKELNNPNLTEEEHLSLLADLTKAEDEYYYSGNYTFRIAQKTSIYGKTSVEISIDDSYTKEFSSHYIEEGVIFRGSPEELIDALTFDTKIYDLFLNIKNPLIIDNQVNEYGYANNWNNLDFSPAAKDVQNRTLWGEVMIGTHKETKTRDVAAYAKEHGYDGVIFKQIADVGGYPGYQSLNPMTDSDYLYEDTHIGEDSFNATNKRESDIIIAFNSNQIKSATDNNGNFSTQNDNVYESKQDIISQQEREQIYNFIEDKKKLYFSGSYYKMDKIYREHVKNDIRKEFESKFPHFRLKFSYNKDRDRLIMYTEPKSKKDITQWQSIIFGKQNDNSPFSESDIEAVMREILKEVRGTSVHERLIADAIAKALKGKHISFEFTTSLPLNIAARYDAYRHVVQINSYATFRNDNNYSNSLTQTIMHELLHAVTVETINGNEQLKSKLEHLLSEVKKALGEEAKDYGLTDIYEFLAELSNIKFVEKLQEVKTGEKDISFFQKVRNFINKVIKTIATSIGIHKNTAYEDAMDLLMQSMFPQDFKLKVVYQENAPTIFDSTAQQGEIKSKIQRQFSILYKAYKKLPNKSAKREQIQNEVFETINELQLQDDQLAINTALNMAIQSIGIVDNLTGEAASSTVLGFLQQQQQLSTPYDGITPDNLVLMYQNSIAFYSNLVKNEIPSVNDRDMTANNRALKKEVEASIDSAYNLWKEALVVVTDKIVDEIVDNEVITSEDQTKEDMKQVLKDYLHRNAMYGDINTWYQFTSNNARSQSPLIKAAFDLIQYAESKTLQESYKERSKIVNAYKKANGLSKKLTRNWQKQFMEFDRDGVPTGYFIRPINYGQYLLDVDDKVKQLNEEFQHKYGFHYITDDVTGKLINSVTKQFADDEEWENGKMPTIVKYQLALQEFKCERANLRYTYDYYRERLSQPYKGSLDPNDMDAKQLKDCHGLSPKTLAKYNLIQSNINYYLSKCKDPVTGFSYPERLTNPEDQRKLDMWQHQLKQLANAYNEDGTIKIDEDRQIAFELRAWQKWIGDQMQSDIDYQGYYDERKRIEQECDKTGDYTPLSLFVKYNSEIGINPNLMELVFSKKNIITPETHDVVYARLIRGMLKSSVKGVGLEPDLKRMMNNIQFWIDCKNTDQIIEDGGESNTKAKDFLDYFDMSPVLYKDEQGHYLDNDLNQTDDEDNAITFYDYMIRHYTEIALNDGQIIGLNDDSGNPINFTQWSEDDIKAFFEDLFTYEYSYEDYDSGQIIQDRKPLSLFNYLNPLNKTFVYNGRTQFSVIEVPKGRFLQKRNSTYINSDYDTLQNQSEQPKQAYYDNSKAYDDIMNNSDMKSLYEQLIDSMKQSQQWMQFNNQQFNYQLPKLQASDTVSILRSTKKGMKNTLDTIREQFLHINTNDYDQRSTDDLYLGPDQTVNQNIPLKFIGKLRDRSKYTYDVTSAVLMYVNMASDYKNKRDILTKLQALRYAQDPENRQDNVNDTENLRSQYDSMMDSHVYGNLYKNSTTRIVAGTIKRLSTVQMLGANFLSMGAGFMDSARNILKDGIVGRYFTLRDLTVSLMTTLKSLPLFLINIGNPIANNKESALMQLFGVAKDYAATSSDVGTNRFIKILNQSLMGGYSALDYISNATLLRAFMNNYRFYDGGVIPTGFYTKYEMQQLFTKAGQSKFKANYAHMCCGTSLYGAYSFKHGLAEIKPEYEQYVTDRIKKNVRGITLLRGALINGVNPDNDNPKYKNTMWGQFIGSMRSWMLQRSQELYAGRDDTSVREVEEKDEERIVNGKIVKTKAYKTKPRTIEQQNKRMSWNYSTSMPEPELLKALYRSLGVMLRGVTNMFGSGIKRKLSEVEKFSLKQVFVEIGMILAMIYSYDSINNWCNDVKPINPQKETIYTPEEVMQSKLYKEWLRNSYVRTVNSAIEQWDVNTVGEIVNSATVLSSGIKSWYSIPSVMLTQDPSNLESYGDKIVKQGKYKGFTNIEASIWKTIGALNNLHSSFTYNGVSANTSFYSRNYSWWMKMIGDQYKPIKANSNKSFKNDSDFGNPDFSNDDFKNPDFSNPDF